MPPEPVAFAASCLFVESLTPQRHSAVLFGRATNLSQGVTPLNHRADMIFGLGINRNPHAHVASAKHGASVRRSCEPMFDLEN